jgi:hypothetical protein
MSIAAFRAVSAIAFELAAEVEAYEADAAQLPAAPFNDVYERVSQRMDKIQSLSASVPALSVAAVALLIAHAEFIYALWHESRIQSPARRSIEEIVREHREAAAALRRACLRQIT